MLSQTPVNRITRGATAGGIVRLAGSVHPLTKKATDLGEVDSGMQLDSLTLNVSLSAAQQNDLKALLEAQQNPQSPLYHQWLTQEQYGARFGLSDADLNAVTGWLQSQGFTVVGVSKSRNAIRFSGKAWQVESAFHTQLHRFQLSNGETHFSNTTDVQVPGGIGSVLLNVRGLNNFRPKPHVQKRMQPAYSVSDGSTTYNFLSPADWATIYNVTPIYNAGYTGTGMHVGVVGQTYINKTDISNFRSAAGLSTANVNYVCIYPSISNPNSTACTGNSAISTGDLSEADLDIEWAGGIAKNATVDFIYAPYQEVCTSSSHCPTDPNTSYGAYDVFDALENAVENYVVDGGVLPVISMSYSSCEEGAASNAAFFDYVDELGAEANSQGQTIVVASGDAGAFGCDFQGDPTDDYPANGGVYATVPADSQYYTGVGGTTLSGDEGNPSSYWNESSTLPGTATTYIPESVWNDTSAQNGLLASSGGISQVFPQPTWQNGLVSGQASWRMVPDVAFAASPEHDGYLVCSASDNSTQYGTACAKGFLTSESYIGSYGGTSAAAPSFAGLLALLVQKHGNLGNINPTLYTLATEANYTTIFHASTGGNNIVPCVVKTSDPGCISSSGFGYSATTSFPYYSMATGLGSVDGNQLFQAPLGSALPPTTTTVLMSPNSASILQTPAQTVTLTAMVSTNSPPGTPTGTVTFTVGSTLLGTATLTDESASLPNVAVTASSGFTAGTDTIRATYSGSPNYAPSIGTATLTVEGTPTTTALTVSPSSVASGGTISLNASVSASGSAVTSGTVTFTVGGTTLGSPVSVTNGTAALSNVTATTANGFAVGSNTVTASYSGTATIDPSSGTATVQVTATPTYTLAASPTAVVITKGGSTTIALNLVASNYTGSVSFTTNVTSSNGTVSAVTASAPSVSFASGSTGSAVLTISTTSSAANHAPARGWKTGGGIVMFAVVLGVPLTIRRKRALAVLLAAAAVSLAGLMMACGGSNSSTSEKTTSSTTARTYSIVVIPTGSGTVTNASPVTITLTVQ